MSTPTASGPTVQNSTNRGPATERIPRRRFLSRMGQGAVALAVGTTVAHTTQRAHASSDTGEATTEGWGLLIDLTRCTGCESCVLACKQANDRPTPEDIPCGLSSEAYSFLDHHTILNAHGETTDQAVKRQCMHCLHPACAAACTVGALRRQANGPVTYDADKCIGCRYCQYACPFGVPTFDWDSPLGLIHKCEMCAERLAAGERPACVSACPNGAIHFGPRTALLNEAHALINSNRARYIDHVYGEHEAGGTGVLYLAAVPFAQLGFPTLGGDIPSHDAEVIMERTPFVAAGMAALATSLYWLTKRHNEILAQRQVTVEVQQPGAAPRRPEHDEGDR